MEEAGKVAIARFVMRNKQYVTLHCGQCDGTLMMSTMVITTTQAVDPGSIERTDGLGDVEACPRRRWPWPNLICCNSIR